MFQSYVLDPGEREHLLMKYGLIFPLQSTVGQNVLQVQRQVSSFFQETVTLGHQLPARTAALELPRPVYYIR